MLQWSVADMNVHQAAHSFRLFMFLVSLIFVKIFDNVMTWIRNTVARQAWRVQGSCLTDLVGWFFSFLLGVEQLSHPRNPFVMLLKQLERSIEWGNWYQCLVRYWYQYQLIWKRPWELQERRNTSSMLNRHVTDVHVTDVQIRPTQLNFSWCHSHSTNLATSVSKFPAAVDVWGSWHGIANTSHSYVSKSQVDDYEVGGSAELPELQKH